MMATNRMRLDLSSPSFYIISLSLTALSEISTPDMCRELSTEVAKVNKSIDKLRLFLTRMLLFIFVKKLFWLLPE